MTGSRPPSVVVLGSVHIDLIASAERLPGPGESVSGGTFSISPGGKAGNQAIQLARCGMRTLLLSCLGDDLFGRELLRALQTAGVDLSLIHIDHATATGASVVMTSLVDYASIIAPGAAARLSPFDVDRAL
ncbi:MAG: ribokinase, partial [Thermomicrobiales bacterium]|nr:ribokinase [Thermomicrobiales bacterium]